VGSDTWNLERLVSKARAKAGLDDLGPGAFEEPLGVLVRRTPPPASTTSAR
jgi:hypothetical protein